MLSRPESKHAVRVLRADGPWSGAVTDLGIEDNFMKELGQSFPMRTTSSTAA